MIYNKSLNICLLILIFILNIFIEFGSCGTIEFITLKDELNSRVFYGNPKSSLSLECVFEIPIIAWPTELNDNITDINAGGLSIVQALSINGGGNSTFTLNQTVTLGSESNGVVYVTSLVSGTQEYSDDTFIKLVCIEYDIANIKYSIIGSGFYYNTFAFLLKISQLEVNLDLGVSVPYQQKYISGHGVYFISFNYNDQIFVQYELLNISILFPYSKSFVISLNLNFKYSTSLPLLSFYPNDGLVSDAAFAELNGISNLNDNYFYSIYMDGTHSDEPFLVSSKSSGGSGSGFNYLVPLSNDQLSPSTYILKYFYNNIADQVLYTHPVNQKGVTDYTLVSNSNLDSFGLFSNQFFLTNATTLPYYVSFGEPPTTYRFPYGFKGNSNSSSITSEFPFENNRSSKLVIMEYLNQVEYVYLVSSQTSQIGDGSNLLSYNLELLPKGRMLVNFGVSIGPDNLGAVILYSSNSQAYNTYIPSEIQIIPRGSSSIRYFQINVPRFNLFKIVFVSVRKESVEYYIGSNYKYNINGVIQSLKSVQDSDSLPSSFNYISGIKSISFIYNDLKVTNNRVSNKMLIKLNNYPIDRDIKVTFIYSDSRVNERKDSYYSNYNPMLSQFEVEFNIPANIKTGNLSYIITLDSLDSLNYYSFTLPREYQLRISESNNIDLMGPIVVNIQKSLQSSINPNQIGWSITINDDSNGFKQGYVIVRGSLDMTERNISISSINRDSGNELSGVYTVLFSVNTPCSTQIYSIIYAYFEDNEGYSTEYDILQINKKNPFYKLLGSKDSTLLQVSLTCNTLPTSGGDSIIPSLNSFKIEPFGFSNSSRTLVFTYSASHQDGISISYLPKVYATLCTFRALESFETTVSSSNDTFTTFTSKLLVPFNYDDLDLFYFSVYGVISNAATVGGYGIFDLKYRGFEYSKKFSSIVGGIITDSSILSSTGSGGLWIYGNYLNSASSFNIQYTDGSNGGQYNTIASTYQTSTAVYFPKIRATNKPIKINAFIPSISQFTESITIYPTIFNFVDQESTPSNNSSLCKGSPLCGGSSHGLCYSTGCKCISPWIGLDCMSQVIKVPPPKIDETNPSTNITLGEDISITSILSIVGIKELSINGNEVNKYIFDQWEYKLTSNDSISTKYSYSSIIKKDNKEVSNITATLDWYKDLATIEYANEILQMNPSTIKYTIKITSYPFTSQLNTLQLIMKASIQSTNPDSCTDKQFGELSQDDSDYIKLQVDNYSFYGRFIKRCIIDNDQIITLTNTLLDSTMNDNLTNNHQTSQSYIGINIGQFQDNVVIDPDFSVILDSSFTKGNCKSSGLTTSQLVGIIVGSVCFFLVLLIIISFIIYKSHGCIPVKIFFYKLFKKSKV